VHSRGISIYSWKTPLLHVLGNCRRGDIPGCRLESSGGLGGRPGGRGFLQELLTLMHPLASPRGSSSLDCARGLELPTPVFFCLSLSVSGLVLFPPKLTNVEVATRTMAKPGEHVGNINIHSPDIGIMGSSLSWHFSLLDKLNFPRLPIWEY
jgi:hypothetical protein